MSYSNRSDAQRQCCVKNKVKNIDANQFFNLLTGPEILEVVESHLPEHRERFYPPTVTLSMFLGQVLSADGSCQNTVNEANISRLLGGFSTTSSKTGAYCSARKRLPIDMVKALARRTSNLMSEQTPQEWLWRGRHVKLVDGTTVLMPDTENNQSRYPQHGKQAAGVGSPLARLVGVVSLSTGAIHDLAMGAYKGKGTGEYGLFRQLRDTFKTGDILLADAYFCSYFLIAHMLSRGVDVLFEQHGARKTDFRKGQKLGVRDHIITRSKPARPSWMSKEEYEQYPDEIEIREVRVAKKVLVTTFLKPKKTAKKALGKLYEQRWNVELDLRNIKTTLGMESLSCKTADMCEKEVWIYILAYNLIRLLMAEASVQAGLKPRQLSFKHTLQIWVAWSKHQILSNAFENKESLFILIAEIQVGKRPGRVEPRAVKRRPKPYPRLQESRHSERERIKKHGHDKKTKA